MQEMRFLVTSDIHNCHASWYGISNDARMEIYKNSVTEAQRKNHYDAALILGDVSLDFWAWNEGGSYLWENKISRTQEFMEKVFPALPKPTYIIPGNHEQYGHEDWLRITGQPREQIVRFDGVTFVMLDSFSGDLDPRVNSDGTYQPLNCELIKKALDEAPDPIVFLCAHFFDPTKESEEFKSLVKNESRIKALFMGHDHKTNVMHLEEFGNKPILHSGNFSYNKERDIFRAFRGWRELVVHEDGSFESWYYVPEQYVQYDGYKVTIEEHEQDRYASSK